MAYVQAYEARCGLGRTPESDEYRCGQSELPPDIQGSWKISNRAPCI